jgi:hypothetical protein
LEAFSWTKWRFLRAAPVAFDVHGGDPGRKAVAPAPICEQQMGQMRI